MKEEVSTISKFLWQNQNILSIGGGIGGLEVAIMKKFNQSNITFIEKDYISKKIRYPNILLIPLVAFDKNLNRVGYGGGFYDRYIPKLKKKKIITIGIAYSFQKVVKIPINNYDIKLDFVVTEKHRIRWEYYFWEM